MCMFRKRKIDFEEFEGYIQDVCEKLTNFLRQSGWRVDYVSPIMRGGLVPATYIANKLNIIKFAPFQVKHVSRKDESKIEMLFNPTKCVKLNKREPVFLLVDGVMSTGTSAKMCIDELRSAFPSAKILYVCLIKEFGSENFEGLVDFECHAKVIGEMLSEDECQKLGIEPNFILFPWENLDIEVEHLDEDAGNIYF